MLFLFPVAWPVASVFLGRAARVCFAALGFLAFGYLHLQQPHVSISMQKFLCLISRWRSSTQPAPAPALFGFWFLGLWCKESLTPPTGVSNTGVLWGWGLGFAGIFTPRCTWVWVSGIRVVLPA